MELENDGGPQSAIAELVDALNRDRGAQGDWRFVDAGNGPGDNPIRLASSTAAAACSRWASRPR